MPVARGDRYPVLRRHHVVIAENVVDFHNLDLTETRAPFARRDALNQCKSRRRSGFDTIM